MRRLSDRQVHVMEIVTSETDVRVADLARRLGVSTVTMRSDIEELAEHGIVRHKHGHVLLPPPTDVAGRQAHAYREKLRIARTAAAMIRGSATLMVGGGSTCALFANEVALRRVDAHIITNSVYLANDIRYAPNIEVTLLGGTYRSASQVNVGPLVRLCADGMDADLLYVGASGWDPQLGPMCEDLFEAEALRAMADKAVRKVLLMDSGKFWRKSVVPLGIYLDEAAVVTDGGVDDEVVRILKQKGAHVIVC